MASSSVSPTPLLPPATGSTEVAQGQATLDARKLRADFPIFEQLVHGKPLAYLDSAVSAQKPRQVLDALREFYETSHTSVHRGVYLLAERATERFEGAREKVRALINAASTRELVFTRSATEALNLVAYAWGLDNLGPATSSSRPSSSTTRTSAPGSSSRGVPARRSARSPSTVGASSSTRSTRSRVRVASRSSP